MTTRWIQWMLWVACLVTVAWLWRAGVLGAGAALATSAGSLLLLAWRSPPQRRRRTALQYIQMGKQPTGFH